jgi:GMP synthase (glutamine-hydrolysing)
VGVQGDERSYRPVLALAEAPPPDGSLHDRAVELINRIAGINRVVGLVESCAPLDSLRVWASTLTPERLERLRRADAVVRHLSQDSGFESTVWQFPVILIPLGTAARPDSVALRPVDSVDGMTARSVPMEAGLQAAMARALLDIEGVCAVFYDLTHKPPGTIAWE